ncbi:MAG: hypothetical protein ACM3Q4_09025 [Acidobacteriota bacterium]
MYELIGIAVAFIIIVILVKIGLKILKWGLILLLAYALWRFLF